VRGLAADSPVRLFRRTRPKYYPKKTDVDASVFLFIERQSLATKKSEHFRPKKKYNILSDLGLQMQ
jgi:hypothetical protein